MGGIIKLKKNKIIHLIIIILLVGCDNNKKVKDDTNELMRLTYPAQIDELNYLCESLKENPQAAKYVPPKILGRYIARIGGFSELNFSVHNDSVLVNRAESLIKSATKGAGSKGRLLFNEIIFSFGMYESYGLEEKMIKKDTIIKDKKLFLKWSINKLKERIFKKESDWNEMDKFIKSLD